MRKRILAGLGVAALALVGVAAPANAVSSTTADLWLVHAFPDDALGDGQDSDVTIDIGGGAIVLNNVAPEAVAPQVDLAPGTYNVTITRESDSTELFNADVTLAAGTSYTAVAHPNAAGTAFTVTVYTNDISTIAAGEATLVERADGERVIRVALDVEIDDSVVREVWLLTENIDGLISLGYLTGPTGEFVIPPSVDLERYSVVDVSAEPLDGDPTHSGDSIVRGALEV